MYGLYALRGLKIFRARDTQDLNYDMIYVGDRRTEQANANAEF